MHNYFIFRPENEREQAGNYDNIINVVDKNMLVFDPKDCDDTFFYKAGIIENVLYIMA